MRHLKLSLIAAILVLQGCADKKDKPVSKAAPPAEPKTVTEYLDQSKNFYDSSPATYCSARLPLDKVPTDQQVATYRIAQNAKTQGMERFFSFLTLYPDQLNVPDPKTGMPILHTLVERNQVEIMKVMVEENFSVGLATVDSQGRLPLHYVNSLEMAQILWELPILNNPQEPWSSRSVGFMNPDKNGQTPLHRLVLNGNPDAVNFAVDKLCNGFRWPWEDRDMNKRDKAGRTALHLAVLANRADSVDALLKCGGVDVGAKDGKGNTALHYAQACEYQDTLWEILESGRSQKDIQNSAGRVPAQMTKADCANYK